MDQEVPFARVPAGLGQALRDKGFTELTSVQTAVLAPQLAFRDLRISSQTGSGKTVAIGLVLAAELSDIDAQPARGRTARPRVLLIAPTRELAQQLGRELGWLYRPLGARVAVVTGGTGLGGDFRALGQQPHVLVGTPGRLLDHLQRASLELSETRAVVLDEADEMLDMGFRDELAGILDTTPAERRTHLVSATLPREVLRLADEYQNDPARVQTSRAGAAHADIEHVGHAVRRNDRFDALINLLLGAPEQRTLVFVRTRADASDLATTLRGQGFSAGAMSGELDQRARNAMLAAFRSGAVRTVVATDVAARGLDIDDVGLVIHFDLPTNAEVFTHRSGRTGRAGNKGTSVALVPPQERHRFEHNLRRVGVTLRWRPVPTPASIQAAADERLAAELGATDTSEPRLRALAERLLDGAEAVDVVAALLSKSDHGGPCSPREVRVASAPKPRAASAPRQSRGRERNASFIPFHVNWGTRAGANPSRLLAMVCRRGNVRSQHIGVIQVGPRGSTVDVASHLAAEFERAARKPDPRNPRVKIRPASR